MVIAILDAAIFITSSMTLYHTELLFKSALRKRVAARSRMPAGATGGRPFQETPSYFGLLLQNRVE
jgi:hypothetical protein